MLQCKGDGSTYKLHIYDLEKKSTIAELGPLDFRPSHIKAYKKSDDELLVFTTDRIGIHVYEEFPIMNELLLYRVKFTGETATITKKQYYNFITLDS